MTDKQDAPSTAFDVFALPGWQVVEATGADAAAFLQAQTMNDLRSLQPGHWQWSGWLTPKGRVIALFALAALDAQRYWLVSPDMPAAGLADRLKRFVFRSKLKLVARDDFGALGGFGAWRSARGTSFHRAVDDERECVSFDLGDGANQRSLLIGTRIDGDETYGSGPTPTMDGDALRRRWLAFDLAHGLPRLPPDQSEQWTPQMLSLDRLRAYSLKKGCYPGQEIVARTHFLGQAKRTVARIVGDVPATGTDVRIAGQVVGTVVSRAGNEALAVVPVELPPGDPEISGSLLRFERLLDGLAR